MWELNEKKINEVMSDEISKIRMNECAAFIIFTISTCFSDNSFESIDKLLCSRKWEDTVLPRSVPVIDILMK